MSVKSKIENLTVEQRRILAHAFDNMFNCVIEFGKNEFVAVHLDPTKNKNLKTEETVGVWSTGTIKRSNNDRP